MQCDNPSSRKTWIGYIWEALARCSINRLSWNSLPHITSLICCTIYEGKQLYEDTLMSGVWFWLSLVSMSAPDSSKILEQAWLNMAGCSGVSPLQFRALRSAPLAISCFATSCGQCHETILYAGMNCSLLIMATYY